MWPWTAVGYTMLALGFLASIFKRDRAAVIFWLIPLTIALFSIFQSAAGVDLGIDRLLFHDGVLTIPSAHPGRPGLNAVSIFILLSGAGLLTRVRSRISAEAGGLAGVVAFAFAAAAVLLVLFSRPADPAARMLAVSFPAAVSAASLAAAFVILHLDLGWIRLVSDARGDWRAMRVIVPMVMLLPVIPSLLELSFHDDLLSPIASELMVVLCNMLILAFVVYWAVTRVASEQSVLIELTEAFDSTTVCLATTDGLITHWSSGCEQLYGWTAAEALGQHKYGLLRSRCQDWDNSLPGHGVDGAQQLVETRRDGREIWVLERARTVESPGRPPIVALSMIDMSERLSVVRALKVSEERLAVATSVHELGVFEWDVASGSVEWTPGTEQRLGIEPGTLNSFDLWREMVEPEDLEPIFESIARAVKDRADKFSYRFHLRRMNGVSRAIEGSARTFFDASGNLVRTVGVMIDVTERDDREAALRRREAQLRSILETLPDAMVVIDENAIILQFSAAAEGLWGYRAADVIGKRATILVPEHVRAAHMSTLHHYRETGQGMVGVIVASTGEAADGRRFPIEIRTGVARADDQVLLTMFVRDLSEQLAAEERMGELSEQIAHVSRQSAMSELAADLAHELNQPLSATSNFLAAARMLIEKGEGSDRVTDLLRMGSDQTQRAGEIIRRMRAFMARGEVEMRTESVEQTVRDAAELVLVGTGQFHIRVGYALDSQAPHIFADRIQVQQVLVNLLRNATQALRGAPRDERLITISSQKLNDRNIQISVADSGPGIAPEILEQLFSRFTTTKGGAGGMGIGLSISKRIIEAHGGELWAENRPEGGAVFCFTLPTAEEA